MNLHRNPQLVERLAAAYALGSLRGGARRRFEALARRHGVIRRAADEWQHRLAGLTELQRERTPPAELWARIAAQIEAGRSWEQATQPSAPRHPARGGLMGLRGLGAWMGAGALVLASLGYSHWQRGRHAEELGLLQGRLQAQSTQLQQARAELGLLAQQPRIGYVAVLNDDRAAAALLATYDPRQQRLVLKRVGSYSEADQKSLQLWSIAPGSKPRSLGVLPRQGLQRLVTAEVGDQRVLAISLEPLGGVPESGGPTGPVLFKGAVLKTEA